MDGESLGTFVGAWNGSAEEMGIRGATSSVLTLVRCGGGEDRFDRGVGNEIGTADGDDVTSLSVSDSVAESYISTEGSIDGKTLGSSLRKMSSEDDGAVVSEEIGAESSNSLGSRLDVAVGITDGKLLGRSLGAIEGVSLGKSLLRLPAISSMDTILGCR
jgi:hypothetical protein